MTTMDAVGLSDAVQALIDARLDTIDRMLVGRVPRSDRLAIVREVEGQIHDLLGERGSDEPGRDDVLAVLARLDPPEAYLPEESGGGTPAVRVQSTPRAARGTAPTASRAGGIVGLCALGLFLLAPVLFGLAVLTESVGPVYGVFVAAGLSFLTGLVAITLAVSARLRGPWAIVGLVTGIASALLSLVGGVVLLFLF
jgi:hypothetical protein